MYVTFIDLDSLPNIFIYMFDRCTGKKVNYTRICLSFSLRTIMLYAKFSAGSVRILS